MAYTKRIWKGRQGTGLNKFSIDGATPVTVVNQPDSLIEAGDALSAGNLNDLETRIDNAFNAVDAEVATKADETEVTDLQNALSATNARVENLEQEHGSYQEVTAKSPYTVPSGKAKNWSVNVLRGVTRASIQLIKNPTFASVSEWQTSNCSYSVSDNVATVTASDVACSLLQDFDLISGHVYLVVFSVKASNSTMQLRISNAYGGSDVFSPKDTSWHTLMSIWTCNTTGSESYPRVYANGIAVGETFQVKDAVLRDLTQCFNGSIPADAQTIADIQTNYPELLVPSEYGSSLVSTRYEGVRSRGFNIWDEVTELGKLNDVTGADEANSTMIRSKNYTEVSPFETYYVKMPNPSTDAMGLFFYDANKNFVSSRTVNTPNGLTFSVPANAKYIRFYMSASYGTSYGNDICINISGSLDGTYKPYVAPSTLSLPTPVELRSAGSVAEEFDLESGEKTNPLGSVDLSTIEGWSYNNSYSYWYATLADMKVVASAGTKPNFLCAGYDVVVAQASASWGSVANKSIGVRQTVDAVCIKDSSITDPTIDLVGKVLLYELATPNAPTQLDPIQNPYLPTEAGGTVSSILTDAVDDSMTLGYINL